MPTSTINVFAEESEGSVSFASGSGIKVVEKTQAQYDALDTYDSDTLDVITET